MIENIPQDGLVFEIANDVFNNSYRPIKVVSVCTALALMAGICGRSHSIKGRGLNLWLLLLAGSGTGKNSISESINRLLAHVQKSVPAAGDFVGAASYASPQALVRHLTNHPSVVSHYGEVGIFLQQLCSPRANENAKGLLRLMLDLFTNSGPNGVIRPTVYSDNTKNTTTIYRPAFSFIGDSTPSEFYKAFSEDQVKSGLIPRFTILEHSGDIPPANEFRYTNPRLIKGLDTLCAHTLQLNSQGFTQEVLLDPNAAKAFADAEEFYLKTVNSDAPELTKLLWTRRIEKAYRIASLFAVGVNAYTPIINLEQARWALEVEFQSTTRLITAFESGEVGEQAISETAQQHKVRAVVKEWFTKPWAELQRYKVGSIAMQLHGIVPHSYISKRLTSDAAFKHAKNGATATIRRTIDELQTCGELRRISVADANVKFDSTATCYMLTNYKDYLSEPANHIPSFF
ncbi:hypothetical protein [Variovorax sp. dw_308]|uniref:hypothetical protein n=1 Tax=Variovorax sp. dw_308 TaxID=2721546 RepID=UPI001C48D803|nr:hypothetical protein [Variovorax sp. dw_308]